MELRSQPTDFCDRCFQLKGEEQKRTSCRKLKPSDVRSSYDILANQPDTNCSWPGAGRCSFDGCINLGWQYHQEERAWKDQEVPEAEDRTDVEGEWQPWWSNGELHLYSQNYSTKITNTYVNKHDYEHAVQFLIQIKRKQNVEPVILSSWHWKLL